MKSLPLILILLFCRLPAGAQQPSNVDSLKHALATSKEDTNKVVLLLRLAGSYEVYRVPDSVLLFSQQAFQLATQLQHSEAIAYSKELMGGALWVMSDYLQADKYLSDAIKFWEAQHSPQVLGLYATISSNKRDHGAYREALAYCFKGDSLDKTFNTCKACGVYQTIIGSIYVEMNMPDSALYYLQQGHTEWDYTKWVIGRAYEEKGNDKLAFDYYRTSFSGLRTGYILKDLANLCSSLSRLFRRQGQIDAAIYYAKTGYDAAAKGHYIKGVWQLGLLLSDIYEPNDPREALRYYKQAMAAKDKIVDIQKTTQLLSAQFSEQLGQQQAEADRVNYRNKTRMYLLLVVLGFFLLLALLLYRNNRHKQKAKAAIEKAYAELKSTQQQLIQQEKMASLGELTAGIAHEIQNPLNFVNNFSELSKELVAELKQEAESGNTQEVKLLASDVLSNLDKVVHHGRRADSIVKAMLQHSRQTAVEKEPTDLNALVEQYLQLAYHGYRAKDNSFNTDVSTRYDQTLGKVTLAPQEVGRVLLNLFNNAFYAVQQKKAQLNGTFEPMVLVSTRKEGDAVQIAVKDNGTGMSPEVAEKVFQPFFTTKPTGEGTGLGLSLSYDIVTKGHGGTMMVQSKEGEGTTFVLTLPSHTGD